MESNLFATHLFGAPDYEEADFIKYDRASITTTSVYHVLERLFWETVCVDAGKQRFLKYSFILN